MNYAIRPATLDDIPHIIEHREAMFRDMGIPAKFEQMSSAMAPWLRQAMPSNTYRAWMAVDEHGGVAASGGLIVIPWPPGPMSMDPRCGFVFNVYTRPPHRKQGIARRLMDAIHDWCRSEGIERVVLNASVFGKSIYQAMGYVETKEPMMRTRL